MKAVQTPPIVGWVPPLNLGCGTASYGMDSSTLTFLTTIQANRQTIEELICELFHLPDRYADSAYAIHVLEHFTDGKLRTY